MSTRADLLARQVCWARSAGHDVDARGYLPTVDANLFRPLSDSARANFNRGSGSELLDTPTRPAKMRALHSSSALAVNVFDHWQGRDTAPLIAALGLAGTLASLRFEAQYPTGCGGTPPNLDVALTFDGGRVVAVESKFSEWLTPKAHGRAPFSPAYFAGGQGRWERRGLPRCQALAEAVASGERRYVYLDAAQLLKHALGLATHHTPGGFSLLYMYCDHSGIESAQHSAEIVDFAQRVDGALGFRAMRYQELVDRLEQTGADVDYRSYLRNRYL